MISRIPMIRRAIPIFLLALAACPTARSHVPDVEVRVTAAPDEARAGDDTVRLTATVRNRSRETLRMELTDRWACMVSFYVRREDTRAVVEPADGIARCEGEPYLLTLTPGESRRFRHEWTPADSLPPGAYTAYAVFSEHHLIRADRREYRAGHRTNEVPLRLTR